MTAFLSGYWQMSPFAWTVDPVWNALAYQACLDSYLQCQAVLNLGRQPLGLSTEALDDPLYVPITPSTVAADCDDSSMPASINSAKPSPKFPPPPPERPPPIFASCEKENPVPQNEADDSNCSGSTALSPQFPPGLKLKPPPGLDNFGDRQLTHQEEGSDRLQKIHSMDWSPLDCTRALQNLGSSLQSEMRSQSQQEVTPVRAKYTAVNLEDGACSPAPCDCRVSTYPTAVEGYNCLRAEWPISEVKRQLTKKLDKPIVSPSFSVGEMLDAKLMVQVSLPQTKDGCGENGKKKLANVKSMLKEGPTRNPLLCNLMLKMPTTSTKEMKFFLTVGEGVEAHRQGPITWNFAEKPLYTCQDFEFDWFHHIHEESFQRCVKDRLLVSVELVS
jgi:hypothetical protein